MIELYAVRLLLAAESLGYILAAWAWWRVWKHPAADRLGNAAALCALCFLVKVIRIAVELMASTA